MKKLLLIIMLSLPLIGMTTNSNDNVIAKAKNYLNNKVDTNIISASEYPVISKILEIGNDTKDGIATAVNYLIEQGGEIVKQYLLFTAITYFLYLLFGAILIFISFKIKNMLVVNKEKAEAYNQKIENESKNEDFFKRKNKYIEILGSYYKCYQLFIINALIRLTFMVSGIHMVITNIIPFIKVSLFPKLYLFELTVNFLNNIK